MRFSLIFNENLHLFLTLAFKLLVLKALWKPLLKSGDCWEWSSMFRLWPRITIILYLESTEDSVLYICNLANISQNMESMWAKIGEDSISFSRESVSLCFRLTVVLWVLKMTVMLTQGCHISTGLGSSTCDQSLHFLFCY